MAWRHVLNKGDAVQVGDCLLTLTAVNSQRVIILDVDGTRRVELTPFELVTPQHAHIICAVLPPHPSSSIEERINVTVDAPHTVRITRRPAPRTHES